MVFILPASQADGLIDMSTAIDVCEAGFVEQGQGLAVFHGQYALPLTVERKQDESGAYSGPRIRVTSGGLLGAGKMGFQMSAAALSPPSGVALLFDCHAGLVAILGQGFGNLRTGAVMAVATKHLAPRGGGKVAMIGSGRNAYGVLEGTRVVRDVSQIKVYSRTRENREAFATRVAKGLDIDCTAVDSAQEAIEDADLVFVSTNAHEPVFDPAWLKRGAYVGSMGRITELDRRLFVQADSLVVGSMEQERTRYYNPLEPIPLDEMVEAGELPASKAVELGDIVSGKVAGRSSDQDLVVFHESQGGFTGTALLAAAYEEARRRGLGMDIDL